MKTVSIIKIVEPSSDTNIQRKLDLKNQKHVEHIHFARVFRPIHYFARAFGLMPFSIRLSDTQKEHFKPRISKFDGLWFVISVCFYATMAAHAFNGRTFLPHESSDLNVIGLGNHLLRSMILVFGIFALFFDMHNRYKLVNILNDFTHFDQEASWINENSTNSLAILSLLFVAIVVLQMASVGIYTSYRREIRRVCLYCIAMTITSVLLIITKMVTHSLFNNQIYSVYTENKLEGFYYLCLNLCRCSLPAIPAIAFTCLLHSLHKRFVALNIFLRFISCYCNTKCNFLVGSKFDVTFLFSEIAFSTEQRSNGWKISELSIQYVPLNSLVDNTSNWSN